MELDHHRHANDSDIYNRNNAGTAYANSVTGGWEFGAMIDISKETNTPNAFLLSLQPHSWRYPEFTNPDGGTLRATENQGSMLLYPYQYSTCEGKSTYCQRGKYLLTAKPLH